MSARSSEYQIVVRALLELLVKGRTLDATLDRLDASPLVQQICYGVSREYFLLDALVDQLLDKPLPKKHADVRMLLLAGIYSVRHLKRPDYASVDRVVEAAKARGKPWARGLVNGVLRNFIRGRKELERRAVQRREARTNHPGWLLDRIEAAWPAQAETIIAANNSRPPMSLRVNRSKITRFEYMRLIESVGMECFPGKLSPDAVILGRPVPAGDLPGFDDGLVSVQDEASQLAAPLMELFAGARVLDACAAPGGKACHMLEVQADLDLVAIDVDDSRCTKIEASLRRLDLHCTVLADDLMNFSGNGRAFDRILLDAPCSATGVIRRHPDIKLLRRQTDIDKLSTTQLGLLDKAWRLLSTDGILLYSTCSILPEENDAVVNEFVSKQANVDIMPVDEPWGIPTGRGRQLLPETGGCDGFFYAKMRKLRLDQ